jgi:hypothetical protein
MDEVAEGSCDDDGEFTVNALEGMADVVQGAFGQEFLPHDTIVCVPSDVLPGIQL